MTSAAAPSTDSVAALAAIARVLTESLELPDVLQRIAGRVRALTGADAVSVLLRRGDLAEVAAHDAGTHGPQIPIGFRFRPRAPLVEALQEKRETLVVLDVHRSPFIPERIRRLLAVRDVLIIPLGAGGELLGALNLGFRQLPEEWTLEPALLSALGDQAAVAVRNARLSEESRRSTQQLVQSEKLSALGRLIARVAHELNKPLTTTRLLAELLETESLEPAAHEHVRAIGREMEHASAVVRDLLLLSRKRTDEFEAVHLADAVREVAAEQERHVVAAGAQLLIDLPADLPPVHADRRGIRHVLSNLVHNAVQALAAGASPRRLAIRARVEPAAPAPASGAAGASAPDAGPRVVVTVTDTGPGISPHAMPHLFEPFFTTKPVGEGTGMGLAIVKEIVEDHGGEVHGENAAEGGAVFRFTLPIARGAAAVARPERSVPEPVDAGQSNGLRVLVIDDEPGLRRAIRRVLEHFGCDVAAAATGEDGLTRARTEPFDLILCDIRMPGLDGRDIYQRLADQAPDAAGRLAFMTGDTISDEVRQFLRSSGRPALAKPFGRAQLADLLRKVAAEGR